MIHQSLAVATSGLATITRFGRGIFTKSTATKPEKLLELYEFENCPYCRLVRESLTELGLDAMIYPCPKGGQRFRAKAMELGGKTQFPFLVDPNTGAQLYESADIIAYLAQNYDAAPPPSARSRPNILHIASSFMASGYRANAGVRARSSKAPDAPLELFSFESSPFARRVRETLCELEIPYILRNVGRTKLVESVPPFARAVLGIEIRPESVNRKALLARSGRVMVPYLVDPNTNRDMFESERIRDYLIETYAIS